MSTSGTLSSVKGTIRTLTTRCWADFEQVSRAEIVHGDDLADRRSVAPHRVEPDQLGVIPLLVVTLEQSRARDVKFGAGQGLCAFARSDALDAGDQRFRRRAQKLNCDGAPLVVLERAVSDDVARLRGEGADAHLALQPLCRPDIAEQHALFGC